MQKQLDEYNQGQQLEMRKLQQEIFDLRAEKAALEEGRRLGGIEAPRSRAATNGGGAGTGFL